MDEKVDKVLIANRGEIALRIIRACRELQLPNLVVFSEADRNALPTRLADEAICIGSASPIDSYLKPDRIIAAAELTGATAIHPGYGFLAENSHFAEACEACKLTFIGPSSHAISILGDKVAARNAMKAAGVPVIPGSDEVVGSISDALASAETIGYPVMLKASAGGGGKGMRVVLDANQLPGAYHTASAEARLAFGNGSLYLEKYLVDPRHVEIQLLADLQGKVLTFGERDCSLQRNHQKMIEESPCPGLPDGIRKQMCEAAVKAAQAVGYTGVGTVEFLYEPSTDQFFFMEMNTRLQVEHPVTEMVTGRDLVRAQIEVALGKTLRWKQSEIRNQGHAIEIRINAEDPDRDFMPCPGTVKFYQPPGGAGVRVDSHLYDGYTIPPFYDSLLAKIIVRDETRELARRKAMQALRELVIEGVTTTTRFAAELLDLPEFASGDYHTGTLEKLLRQRNTPAQMELR
ncbi:MAG: acetyl-CoA carboxylase biotin carboxylase subunit [Victivallales bacterium]|nr:acetyl-CoA carboxylase biotin carboxylase subunit [Victivallales bacterium]